MTTSVRPATPGDADLVAGLLHDFNVEFDGPPPRSRFSPLEWPGCWQPTRPWSCSVGSGPDGLAVLRFRLAIWSEGLECYLAELYVVPDRRGQGSGAP